MIIVVRVQKIKGKRRFQQFVNIDVMVNEVVVSLVVCTTNTDPISSSLEEQ